MAADKNGSLTFNQSTENRNMDENDQQLRADALKMYLRNHFHQGCLVTKTISRYPSIQQIDRVQSALC